MVGGGGEREKMRQQKRDNNGNVGVDGSEGYTVYIGRKLLQAFTYTYKLQFYIGRLCNQ